MRLCHRTRVSWNVTICLKIWVFGHVTLCRKFWVFWGVTLCHRIRVMRCGTVPYDLSFLDITLCHRIWVFSDVTLCYWVSGSQHFTEMLGTTHSSGVKQYKKNIFYTYLLTPWCRVLLEKLTSLQLVKKFPAFHGTRKFITALTSVRHLSLSWASPIQCVYPHPTSWRSILILSTHLRLGLPSGLFPSGFPNKTIYTPLSSPIFYLLYCSDPYKVVICNLSNRKYIYEFVNYILGLHFRNARGGCYNMNIILLQCVWKFHTIDKSDLQKPTNNWTADTEGGRFVNVLCKTGRVSIVIEHLLVFIVTYRKATCGLSDICFVAIWAGKFLHSR